MQLYLAGSHATLFGWQSQKQISEHFKKTIRALSADRMPVKQKL
jgi:hypothetical protein